MTETTDSDTRTKPGRGSLSHAKIDESITSRTERSGLQAMFQTQPF